MISIKVPPLGESIVEATVARWLKKDGDPIAAGETLVELETDKITVEVPAPKTGVLTRRQAKEGDVVKVEQALAEMDETASGAKAGASAAPPAPAQKASTQQPSGQQAASPPSAQQPPAQKGSAPTAPSPQAAPPQQSAGAGVSHGTSAAPSAAKAGAPAEGGAVKSSPAAQRLASESGVDLTGVQGTGRGGVVSKPDVVEQAARAASAPAAAPSAPPAPQVPPAQPAAPRPAPTNGARETREKMTTRRKRIAENLLNAKQATALLTTFNEIDMSAVMKLRDRFKEKTEKQYGVKLTFMPFFVKAACIALKDIPVLNAQVDGDSIIYKHYVNMGIAVASDAGLVVPNIRDADTKGVLEISRDLADVAKRARDGKLTMDDLTGGTFTITNGGVFGSLLSTPIVNHPQVGILGLHKIQERPVAIEGKVEVRSMMYVALSYDHRIVDGQHSVLFLVKVKELMEDPAAMLIE
jgi:2-oxoglutarate dehydrogenase E2 component (dihydrolipoamide succinyltransferase)